MTQVFSYEFFKIIKNIYFTEQLQATFSAGNAAKCWKELKETGTLVHLWSRSHIR